MNVLVTGGAGYIGSHAIVALLQAGHSVVVLDNLSNGAIAAIERAASLGHGQPAFYEGDIRDRPLLDKIFSEQPIDAVMHFAGVKAVGESVENPLRGQIVKIFRGFGFEHSVRVAPPSPDGPSWQRSSLPRRCKFTA